LEVSQALAGEWVRLVRIDPRILAQQAATATLHPSLKSISRTSVLQ
jgi:hypothetical protein